MYFLNFSFRKKNNILQTWLPKILTYLNVVHKFENINKI